MSLFGSMNTAISGMNAQTNKLSAVGDNIANADTIGYKKAEVKFSTFLLPSTNGTYNSGGVQSHNTFDVETQGALKSTSSATDIAIQGRGFFVVQDMNGADFLTRSGSFTMDASGNLVNSAGYTLMGTPIVKNGATNLVNGLNGLIPINLQGFVPKAAATQNITLGSNVDSRAKVVAAANLPSANGANASFTNKTSVTAYDSLGALVVYDVYYTKKTDAAPASGTTPATDAQWDVAIYRHDDGTAGGFPYGKAITNNTMTMTFDSATGKLKDTSGKSLSIIDSKAIPQQTINFDFSSFTQLATEYSMFQQDVDGQKATKIISAKISTDGTVSAIYDDNTSIPTYRIPLADVASPDNLETLPNNVYRTTNESGIVFTGFPGEGSFGKTIAGALEASNVDMANELTDMIQAQRNYTANSKVFQTGADLMDILVNLKR